MLAREKGNADAKRRNQWLGIGRATLKIALEKPTLHVTAVNDVLTADNLAYLLKFDTVYGRWGRDVRAQVTGSGHFSSNECVA